MTERLVGAMKPGNAAAILAIPHVNGGLVGGASLEAKSFASIVKDWPR